MEASYRLPRDIEPVRYEISLTPDLAACRFTGEERIEVRVTEATDTVVLNALDLDVTTATFTTAGTRYDCAVSLDPDEERVTLRLPVTIRPGDATVELGFAGEINDKLRGLYLSTFRDEADEEHRIATTQFEATDARRCFPCWDEPDRKATFTLTLIVDEHLTALSNAQLIEEHPTGDANEGKAGKKVVRFAETMKMSTYLVAFVVGPFEVTPPVDVDGVALRVAARPGQSEMAGFALEIGAHALRFFSEWFAIPYPADKLDLVALPDFAFGAMENLGCVTFRENLLIIDPTRASRGELEAVADVVAHEIAHMWFGDLVTMKWWNGIWLNEAFATFMELLCVDDFRPDWERWVSFSTGRSAAMLTDGLASTRPVEYPVGRPEEAEGMFDVLTYQKGGSVLRMLERYLGADDFRSGIRRYLDTHQYANAETADLWDAIESATDEPVRAVMDSWINQGGYPLVSVGVDKTGANGFALTLTQQRFAYLNTPHADVSTGVGESRQRWHVPVMVRAGLGGGKIERRKLLMTSETARLELPEPPEWVIVNDGGWGFFRVNYEPELLRSLVDQLGHLDAIERYNLVSDTWAAVIAGNAKVAGFVDLVGHLTQEGDPNVWSAALAPFGLFEQMLIDRSHLASFLRELAGPAFAQIGWERKESEHERVRALRPILIEALGNYGADPEIREQCQARFADTSTLDPDLAGAVTRVVATTGGVAEYEEFLTRRQHASTPQEELRYLYGITAFRDLDLVRRTLNLCITEVRTQNAPYLLAMLLRNRDGGEATWAFMKDHWDEIVTKFPDNSLPRMLEGVTALSASPELASDVHSFLASHPLRSGHQQIDQHLERLDINVAFRSRETETVRSLFA